MKRLPIIIIFMFLLFSCNQQSSSSDDKESTTADTVSKNGKDTTGTTASNPSADSLKQIRKATLEPNIFERIVGRWVFVKSFLPEGRSIDASSFSIKRAQIESAGYAYFVRFSGDEQEWLLSEEDSNTVTYSDGYGTFKYNTSTDHLFVTISDISNAEYRRSN